MKAVCIVIKDNKLSENGYARLLETSNQVGNGFDILKFDAITPETVDQHILKFNIEWNYPVKGSEYDKITGLFKSAYATVNLKARIACAVSHYCIWAESVYTDKTMLILEHDAIFIEKLDFDPDDTNYDIIGINNPINATRKSNIFHLKLQESDQKFQSAPIIDDNSIPQGLAGNSAYILKPKGAKKLLELVDKHGLWPNDSIMCRQLIPTLGVTKKYYTKVQGLRSTTAL
jgi:GR25 family glycosyltransferase involved in LPS biosynthesis